MGCDVRAFVIYNSLNGWGWLDHAGSEIIESIEVIPGDIRDHMSVDQAVRGCDVVFHLAALISIPYSYRSPDAYIDTDVKGSLNVFEAARKNDVE